MKQKATGSRILALLLAVTLLASLVVPAAAAGRNDLTQLAVEQIDNDLVTAQLPGQQQQQTNAAQEETHAASDMVRVSIVLEKKSTLEAGYTAQEVTDSARAMSYRESLQAQQETLSRKISRVALDGQKLDVVWNLTLAANVISANVPYGAIEKIAAMDGVKSVVEEQRYEPQAVSADGTQGTYEPQMGVAGEMTGAHQAWQNGYTGAGMRVAVIDTGLDTDHQSFDPDALTYGVEQASKESGVNYASQLLTTGKIETVLDQLNAYQRNAEAGKTVTADQLYVNAKAPFGYNYIDGNFDVTHDNDSNGSHGSHVSGIAAANRYLKTEDGYVDALETVNVAGNAPDAQILVMKVFGANGGAYDSDIMAAMEDALVLGADAINLSLGSSVAGRTESDEPAYVALFERLVETDTVVAISAGNYGYWAENTAPGQLYRDGINYATGGSPGSYTNAYTVASLDNDGTISPTFKLNGSSIGLTESLSGSAGAYTNASIATLDTSEDGSGTEYPFVLVDSVGELTDYTGMDLSGKIVFVARGSLAFSLKANNAASLGAAAVGIYNVTAGSGVGMDLSTYTYSAPVVSITQADSQKIRAAGTAQTTENGTTYYTGTIKVSRMVEAVYNNSEEKTISSFSSWGLPSDLTLKPEITAPGGSIYSVNGMEPSGTSYELNSGTSMAAPQITGISALLLQYLQENGLSAQDLTARGLAQALLGSTAEPLTNASNGSYYSLLQQGGGLANVANAMRTPVYLTVPGTQDGKVKVELGDDPDRTGVYEFAFQLNNLSDEAVSYLLSADLFTQDVSDSNGVEYLSILTRAMDADVTFSVNGETVSGAEDLDLSYDFNGDGRVTTADAQHLLDHVTKGTALAANASQADLNGDGVVNTYDVHLFLALCQASVEVPASGSVTVNVSMTLTDAEKARLAADYPVGAYVEAFVKAAPLATEEGELLPQLSLPVLAFYGGWNEASMYDVGTYTEYMHGTETRASYFGDSKVNNSVSVSYGENSGTNWYFGGNPVQPDETYMPERNAINLARGDRFATLSFALIRNAGAYRVAVTDDTNGETIYLDEGGQLDAAYYIQAYYAWAYAPAYYDINFHPDMEEGERGTVSLTTVVDLYANDENKWDKGDTLEVPFLVDNTAPAIEKVEVDHENNVLRVTASDNQQVAGVALYDVTGRTLLASCGSDPDAKPGDTVTLEVPLDYVDGYKFVIQVVDYAVNKTTYKLKETIGEPGPMPEMLYFNSSAKEWMIGNWPADPGHILMDSWFDGETDVTAATAVGYYIFYVDSGNNLYAGPGDNLWESAYICTLDVTLKDMTYDWDNGIIYAVTSTGMLVQVDRMSGAVTELGKVDVGSAYYNAATIAYAGSGLFYCTRDGSYPMLYSFTLDTMDSSTSFSYLEPSYSRGNQCLEYNRADGKLYYVLKTSSGYELWKLSTETPTTGGEYRYFFNDVTAIVFPDWSEHANDWFDPNGKVSAVTLDKAEAELFRDKTLQLSAQVMPWNAADRTVTWSSDNTEVATVDANGLVTGVGIGTANITAAATADPSVTASCQVTVSILDVDLSGVLIDSDNQSRFYTWNTANDKTWTPGATVAKDAIAASLTPDGSKFWMLDNKNVTYEMDAATGEVVSDPYTSLTDQFYSPHGIAYSAQFSTEEQPMVYYIRDGQLSYPRDPASTDSMSFLSLGYSTKHKNLTSVTCAGTEVYNRFGTDYDSDVLYMTDDLGRVWRANVYHVVTAYSSYYTIAYTTTESTLPENVFASKDFSSLVLGEDGALYLSAYSGDYSTLYRLTYNADTNVYEAMGMGTYGNKVWPALLFSVTENDGESTDASAAEPFRGFVAERSVQPQLQSAVTAAARPLSVNPGQGSENTVTLDLNAENATNGKLTVNYDADVLTLTAVDAAGMTLTSYLSEDGTLTFGYAAKDAVSGKLATLHFAYDRSTCPISTTVTVSTLEENENTDRASENVTLKLRDVVVIPGEPGKPTEPGFPFKDVTTDHPFYEDIQYVYEKGLMQGVSEDVFQSATTTTRGMIATILYRMEGEPAAKNASSFKDVADGMFYSNAVAWAAANGIVNGYADGTFQPDQTISREQMAAILYRYAQYKGCDVSVGEDTNILSYTDAAQVASYAVPAFQWAVGAGIINGTTATTLSPKGSATRGQVAAILHRYCEWIG